MATSLFGPPPSYTADGFTGNTTQDWSRQPASGTYFSKIIGISDGRGLNTIGPPPIEGNFEVSDPIATDIKKGTQIGIECRYQAFIFNATTVQIKFDLHVASTGVFIASTAFQILLTDGLFHTETFNITGLGLTDAQTKDLGIKMSTAGGGWILPLDAFINVDSAIPTLTYQVRKSIAATSCTEKTIAAIAHTEKTIAAVAHTEKTIAAIAHTEKTIATSACTGKTIIVV